MIRREYLVTVCMSPAAVYRGVVNGTADGQPLPAQHWKTDDGFTTWEKAIAAGDRLALAKLTAAGVVDRVRSEMPHCMITYTWNDDGANHG